MPNVLQTFLARVAEETFGQAPGRAGRPSPKTGDSPNAKQLAHVDH